MKILKIITFIIISIGITSTFFLSKLYLQNKNPDAGFFFNLIPYFCLYGLMYYLTINKAEASSHIALFTITFIVCFLAALAYYKMTDASSLSSASHRSTEALGFVLVPIFSLSIIIVGYPLIIWIAHFIKWIRKEMI